MFRSPFCPTVDLATPRDYKSILKVARRSKEPPVTSREIVWFASTPKHVLHVVRYRGSAIAFSMMIRFDSRRLGLGQLVVDPAYRHNGVGTLLMDYLVGYCKATGRSVLASTIRESDLSGREFLIRCGFRAIHVVPEAFDEEDGYRFIRDVEPNLDALCVGR